MDTKAVHGRFSLLENIILKKGRVLAVRSWLNQAWLEVDLHLPQCHMEEWQSPVKLNCRVGAVSFRDYTPANCQPADKTCSLYIDAGHPGVGSDWAKSLREGDMIQYISIDPVKHAPVPGATLVFIGDQASVGHFNAIRRLAGQKATVTGALLFRNAQLLPLFATRYPWLPAKMIPQTSIGYSALFTWIEQLPADASYVFYLAGQVDLVAGTSKFLKKTGYGAQVRGRAFWK